MNSRTAMLKFSGTQKIERNGTESEPRRQASREHNSEKIIEKIFSEIDFGRYSIAKSAFIKAAKVENQLTSVMAKLENWTAQGFLNFSNGFYGLTKEGRNYFTERKGEKIVIRMNRESGSNQDS